MRVFYSNSGYSDKVNFVDENNVLVGYSNTDDCCAHGGWFIADDKDAWLHETFKEEVMDLPGFVFDKNYAERKLEGEYAEGGAIQFKLINGDKEKFLTLYNFHNGYYARGFEISVGGQVEKEDLI